MAEVETARLGRRGTVVIPSKLRKRFGLREGSFVIAEAQEDGILLRPAMLLPTERYTPERIAEFILGGAVDADDYAKAVEEVRRMGLDPAKIDHYKPNGV